MAHPATKPATVRSVVACPWPRRTGLPTAQLFGLVCEHADACRNRCPWQRKDSINHDPDAAHHSSCARTIDAINHLAAMIVTRSNAAILEKALQPILATPPAHQNFWAPMLFDVLSTLLAAKHKPVKKPTEEKQ